MDYLSLLRDLVISLNNLKERLYGNKKVQCERLLHNVQTLIDLRQDKDLEDLHNLPVLAKPLERERAILDKIKNKLNLSHPSRFDIFMRWRLGNFLAEESLELENSSASICRVLETYRTASLIKVVNQLSSSDRTHSQPLSLEVAERPVTNTANNRPRENKTEAARNWMNDFFRKHGIYFPNKDKMLLQFCTKAEVFRLMVSDSGGRDSLVIKYNNFTTVWNNTFSKYITLLQAEGELTQIHTTITITTISPSNIHLPQLGSSDRSSIHLARLDVHLTGALFEVGSGKQPHLFRDFNHIPHDSNFIIYCILRLLVHHKHQLNETLLLQLYWPKSELKKSVLHSFVSLLVHSPIFNKIYVRFLPEAPIIKSVRNIFHEIPNVLRNATIPYLDDLDMTLQVSSVPNLRTEEIQYVFNTEEWMAPYLNRWQDISDEATWLLFDKQNGTAMMKWRSTLDSQWVQSPTPNNETEGILQSVPQLIPQSGESKRNINKLRTAVSTDFSAQMSPENFRKWNSLMETLSRYFEVPDPPPTWPLQVLMSEPSPSPDGASGPITN